VLWIRVPFKAFTWRLLSPIEPPSRLLTDYLVACQWESKRREDLIHFDSVTFTIQTKANVTWSCQTLVHISFVQRVWPPQQNRKTIQCWIKSWFLLFLDQNVFSKLQNILTNPMMSHGLLWWCLYFLSEQGHYTLYTFSMEGQKALRLNRKYLKLCPGDERRSYGLGTS